MFKSARLTMVLSVLVVIIMAVTLTGCPAQPAAPTATTAPAATKAPAATTAPAATSAPAATTAPAASTPAAAAPAAKLITVYMSQEPDTLFPQIGSMMAKEEVLGTLFTDCVTLDDQNTYVARGCESVPSVDNGGAKFVGDGADKHLEVTFKLKKYKWSDGNPVTSKDIKFSWDLMLNPDFNAEQRDAALKVADVQTPDDQTAIMVYMSENQAKQAAVKGWKYDNKSFYEGYDTQSGPVIDPLYMISADLGSHFMPSVPLSKLAPKDMEKSDFARNPIGNGPYKFKDWVPAQTVAVEATDNGLYKPQIQTIVFKLVADATAILNGLAAGEGQVTTQVGLDVDQSPEIDKLAQDGKIKPYYIPASAWEHIDFNLQDPLLQDVNVRHAIAYAVDRKTIVDKLLFGKSKVMDTWIAPPHWALNGNDANIIKYDYNPQKAKDVLAQAGWKAGSDGILEKNGQKLRLKLQTTTAKIRQSIGPLVQANLKDVGIQVDPEYLPGRGLFETNGPLLQHSFQLGLYTWVSNPDPDPTNLYLGKNCPDGANYPCYKSTEFDKLTAQQASELSQAKRTQIIGQALKVWTNDLPTLPLFQRLNVTAAVPKLQNFKPTPSNTPETWNAEAWFLPAS